MESARESGQMASDQVAHAAQSTKETASHAAQSAKESTSNAAQSTKESAQESKESVTGFIQQVLTQGPTYGNIMGPTFLCIIGQS